MKDNRIRTINIIIIISIIAIVSLEIRTIRGVAKAVYDWILYISSFENDSVLRYLDRYFIERCAVFLILLSILAKRVFKIVDAYKNWRIKSIDGENIFETSLLKYLNSLNSNKCFLIRGSWGSGKTHILESFIKKYYSGFARPIYRISCFGLTDRRDLISEINKVIKDSDVSIRTLSLSVIRFIPVLGDALATFLQREYSYSTANKNSIFIFDDFERISIHRFRKTKWQQRGDSYSRSVYEKSLREPDLFFRDSAINLSGIEDLINNEMICSNSEKYIPAVSIINEMIEKYHYKVIIICNTDYMGEQFIRDILKSKLNCYEYRKTITDVSAKDYAKEILSLFVIDDSSKAKYLEEFVARIDYNYVIDYIETKNLRLFGNIIEAFVDTAVLFEMSDLSTEGFADSLFHSILIYHFYNDKGNKNVITHMDIGENLSMSSVSKKPYSSHLRWVGYEIASYWFNNYPNIENIHNYVLSWINYKYIDIEEKLIYGDYNALEDSDYEIRHLYYMLSRLDNLEYTNVKWKDIIDNYIKKNNMSDNNAVHRVLTGLENCGYSIKTQILDVIFRKLAESCNWKKDNSDIYYAREYNDFVLSNQPTDVRPFGEIC